MANDPGDPKSVRRAQKQAERNEEAAKRFLRASMATVEGRAYFLRWLERCYVFLNPYAGSAEQTAFNCGVLHTGQELFGDIIAWCPDQYILMMREREDGRRSSDSSDNGSGRNKPDTGWDDSDGTDSGDSAEDGSDTGAEA